jgi:hypothetical protein
MHPVSRAAGGLLHAGALLAITAALPASVSCRSDSAEPALERLSDEVEPAAEPISARDERETLLREIRRSGHIDRTWVSSATRTFAAWRRAGAPALSDDLVRLSEVECYRRACFVTARYPSLNDWHSWRAELPGVWLRAGSWQGGRGVTGPDVLPSGEVVSAWILRIPTPNGTEKPHASLADSPDRAHGVAAR